MAYRRRKGTTGFPRQTSYNLPLEIFYTAIPLFPRLTFFYFTCLDVHPRSSVAGYPLIGIPRAIRRSSRTSG
ncbi:hypothetical protein CTI14_49540 [Methylobacterium radiotolerans]|nr:hypothetical protein CTI14_49540 [Methylobacterium radiotolerans]